MTKPTRALMSWPRGTWARHSQSQTHCCDTGQDRSHLSHQPGREGVSDSNALSSTSSRTPMIQEYDASHRTTLAMPAARAHEASRLRSTSPTVRSIAQSVNRTRVQRPAHQAVGTSKRLGGEAVSDGSRRVGDDKDDAEAVEHRSVGGDGSRLWHGDPVAGPVEGLQLRTAEERPDIDVAAPDVVRGGLHRPAAQSPTTIAREREHVAEAGGRQARVTQFHRGDEGRSEAEQEVVLGHRVIGRPQPLG